MFPNDKIKQYQLDQYRNQGLPVDQLRTLIETLYDGNNAAYFYLTRIRAFYTKKKNLYREHQVYLWLVRNKLTGQKLVEFFENEDGFLNGMNIIINRIEGRVYSMERIKIDEAL